MAAQSRDFSLPAGMAPPPVGSAELDALLDSLTAGHRTATAERPATSADGAQLPQMPTPSANLTPALLTIRSWRRDLYRRRLFVHNV